MKGIFLYDPLQFLQIMLLLELPSPVFSLKVYKLRRNVIQTIPHTQFGICFAKGMFGLWHFATKGTEKEQLSNIKALCKTYPLPLDIPPYSCTFCFRWQQPRMKFYGQCWTSCGSYNRCYTSHGRLILTNWSVDSNRYCICKHKGKPHSKGNFVVRQSYTNNTKGDDSMTLPSSPSLFYWLLRIDNL
jgi:hypothetical protein